MTYQKGSFLNNFQHGLSKTKQQDGVGEASDIFYNYQHPVPSNNLQYEVDALNFQRSNQFQDRLFSSPVQPKTSTNGASNVVQNQSPMFYYNPQYQKSLENVQLDELPNWF